MDSQTNTPPFSLSEKEVTAMYKQVGLLMKTVKWKPEKISRDSPVDESGAALTGQRLLINNFIENIDAGRAAAGRDVRDKKELIEIFGYIDDQGEIMTENVNLVANTVMRGISIGACIFNAFQKASGAKDLAQRDNEGGLSSSQRDELHKKQSTGAAILLFVASTYIVWKLSQFDSKELEGVVVPEMDTPNFHLTNQSDAMKCVLYYFALYIDPKNGGVVRSGLELVKFAKHYFELVVSDIKERKGGLLYLEMFENSKYQLEGEPEFVVNGFEPIDFHSVAVMDIVPTKFSDIVGNPEVKLQCKRLVQRLLAYDLVEQKNPFLDDRLGGFPNIAAGYGPPGTGKSMLIAAVAGSLKYYCEKLGIPFQFAPLPGNIISTFQGGSAERAMAWFKLINNPNCITFAPIDDAENTMQDRAMEGVSSGVREFIGEFLRSTEGATAVQRGQLIIYLMTNLLEQVDPAIVSRIKNRAYIGGAETLEDWIDQNYLWWSKHKKGDEGFVNFQMDNEYEFMKTQKEFKSFGDSKFDVEDITDPDLKNIVMTVLEEYDHKLDDFKLGADIFFRAQQIYPFVTSREVRNVQTTVDFRLMDFDLPEEWLEDPELFVHKSYETKVEMLLVLKKQAMKGIDFATVTFQETIRHLNTLIDIKNTARKREIEAMAEHALKSEQAQALIKKRREQTGESKN